MPPTQAQPEVTMDTAQATLDRAKAMVQPSISAEELANPPETVKPPVPTVSTNDGSRTQGLVDNVTTNTQGFIASQSEEAARAKELAGLLGDQTFDGQGQRTQLGEQYGLPQNLSRLTDIQTQLTKANTASGLTKVGIEGAAGQTLGQAGREITQEDRENAVRNAGLAAEAAVLQGSIETASTLVNNAMSDYYNDRQLQNANMIQQLNYFSGIADEQTSQLLGKEQRKYEEDQAKVERVLSTVDTAMVSGAATPEELGKLTDPKSTDEERLSLSQNIIARRASQEYNLDKAIKGRQYEKLGIEISSAYAKAKAAEAAAASGKLTETQLNTATELRKEVNNLAEVKAAKDLEPNMAALLVALDQENGIGDISAINTFQRLAVDPGVAVREGDVALLQSAQSFTDQSTLRAKGLLVGDKLTPEARTQMKELAEGVYNIRVEIVDENTQQIRTMASEQGIDYGKYVGKNFATFAELSSRVSPEDAVTFGVGVETDAYLDGVVGAISENPAANPFGVDLSNN